MKSLMRTFIISALMISGISLSAWANPEAISNLTALSSAVEGQISLSWTSPDPHDGITPAGYTVKYSTCTEIRNTYFDAPDGLSPYFLHTYAQSWTALVSSGMAESRTLTGLLPGATMYFAIVARDSGYNYGIWRSSTDTSGECNNLQSAVVFDTVPVSVAGLSLAATSQIINVSWTANPEVDVNRYYVEYSSYSDTNGFQQIAQILTPVTTHQQTGLINGNTYYYRVRCRDNTGNIGEYSTVRSTTPWVPLPTITVTTGTYTSSNIEWHWNRVNTDPGTIYRVYNSTSGANLSGNLSSSTTYWIRTDLLPNTSYGVYVEAINGLMSKTSAVCSVYTLAAVAVNATATDRTTSSIDIAWDGNGNPSETRYTIRRSTDNFFTFSIVMNLAASTTHQDTGLLENSTYQYKIWSYNNDSIFVVNEVLLYSTATLSVAPSTPIINGIGTGTQDGEVTLDWVASGDDGTVGMCTAYTVKWGTWSFTSNDFDAIAVSSVIAATKAFPLTEVARTIGGLYPGSTYWFALKARDDSDNYSLMSATATAVARDLAPNTPQSLTGLPMTVSTANLAWNVPTFTGYDDRDVYKIYRATFSFSSFTANVSTFTTLNKATTYYTDTGLSQKTTYYYRISCLDKGDLGNGLFSLVLESPLSPIISVYMPDITPPAAVASITAFTGDIAGRISLAWTSPGNDGSIGAITNGGHFRIDYSTDAATIFVHTSYQIDLATTTSPNDSNERMLTGLFDGSTYYIRVWTRDEAGNWSAVSAGATAWAQVDVTAPSAITAISTSAAWRRISLTWTLPGDDGSTNALNGAYEIRLSSVAAIQSEPDWANVSPGYPYRVVSNASGTPGSTFSRTVTGLTDGTTYYVAIKTADERFNWSVLSTTSPYGVPVNRLPGAFSITTPPNNSKQSGWFPSFSWSASVDADVAAYGDSLTYTVYFSTDPAFGVSIFGQTSNTNYITDLSAYENMRVYVKVAARDSDTVETWSDPSGYSVKISSVNSSPNAFDVTNPADASIQSITTPTLAWGETSDPDPDDSITYRVDYSRIADFSSYDTAANITTTHYTLPPLVENATYWWRVWASDGGLLTRSASIRTLRINAVPEAPAAFDLALPVAGHVSSNALVTCSWQPTIDPDPADTVSYSLTWSKLQDFSSSFTVTGLSLPTTTLMSLEDNSKYFWFATAIGSDGQSRNSTQTGNFFVDLGHELPATFALLSPTSTIVTNTLTPSFVWAEAIDPDPEDEVRYVIDISPSPDFSGLGTMASSTGRDRYFIPLVNLIDQSTYYWRVRATGYQYQSNGIPLQVDSGFTTSSSIGVFVLSMTNSPPLSFALASPAAGSEVKSKQPAFAWRESVDPDFGSSVSYSITLSTTADLSTIYEFATGIAALNYTPARKLLENRTYYWKVKATDNKQAETMSEQVFTFVVPVLNTPQAPAGISGALSADKQRFTLSWSAIAKNDDSTDIDDLAGYRIYRGLSPQKMSLRSIAPTNQLSWVDENTDGGNIYYRVTAFDTSGVENVIEESPVISSLSDGISLVSADSSLNIDVPAVVSQFLHAQNNTYNKDLRLKFDRVSANENDQVITSYRLRVLTPEGVAVDRVAFSQPLTLTFNYAATTGIGKRLAAKNITAAELGDFNIFWHNGVEYQRLGGANNSAGRSVALKVVKPGEYQLRRVSRARSFGVASIYPPKLFTPGIAPFEKITFNIDNPTGDKVTGKIYDLKGEFVADCAVVGDATSMNVILEWEGVTTDNQKAHKGVYIYQIENAVKVVNGTIMVAR